MVILLVDAMHSEIFMPNDVLVKANSRGDALYFIASGTVAVYNNMGKEVKDLRGKICLRWKSQFVAFSI